MNQVVADTVQETQVVKLPVLVIAVYMVDFKFVIHCEAKLAICAPSALVLQEFSSGWVQCSHSRRWRMPLKVNDLSHSAFVNIKPIESTTYVFYAVGNAASFELSC